MNINIETTLTKIVFPMLLCAPILSVFSAQERTGLYPNLETQLIYDDNIRAVTDELKESDQIFVIKPDLDWIGTYGKHQFNLGYRGNYGFYFDETDLNYNDHQLTARALFDHSYRSNTEFNLAYQHDHDPPGQTDAIPRLAGEYDKWRNWNALGKFYYGRDDSRGQIVVQLAYDIRRYTNNNQEFRDYDKPSATGTFFYQVAPKTRLLLEAGLADYDYQNESSAGASQSNKEYRYLTGITWDITAISTGVFKIGYQDKQYESSAFGDTSELTFSLDGIWNPNTFTKVTFGASRQTQESAQQNSGGFVQTILQINVRHAISPRSALVGGLGYGKADFDNVLDRQDNHWRALAGVKHSLLRWLEIGAEYRYEERDSTLELFDFKSNIFMITASTKLD